MKLITLEIRDFKGIKSFTLETAGANVNVYGENGTGKTTIADAYTWLLTGKNSRWKSDFEVFPFSAPDGTDAVVMGTFYNKSGIRFTLKRVYTKVFNRKNGEAEKKLKNFSTKFYISDVPKTQKDYMAFIEENFGPMERLFILTDPGYFAEQLDYRNRRKILLQTFAPHYDDQEVIKAHPELNSLGNYIGAMSTVAELAEQLKAERKIINLRLAEIPGRIDENVKSRPEVPVDADPAAISSLAAKRLQQQNQLTALESGEEISRLRLRINEQKSEKINAEAEHLRKYRDQNKETEAQIVDVELILSNAKRKMSELATNIEVSKNSIAQLSPELDHLRASCKAKYGEQFDVKSSICPTCGQTFPQEHISELQENFNLEKATAIEYLKAQGIQKKERLSQLTAKRNEDEQQLREADSVFHDAKKALENLQNKLLPMEVFSETAPCKQIDHSIAAFEQKIKYLQTENQAALEKARQMLESTEAKLRAITDKNTTAARIKEIDQRVTELKAEETKLGGELAKKEKLLKLTEDFTQMQADDIEGKINSAFTLVKWKLFDRQKNEGINPCCEAMVDGVAYTSNLNTAKKMNAGLDIINTLTATSKLDPLPIIIDNAESVTKYIDVLAQVMWLHVDKNYQKIEVQS